MTTNGLWTVGGRAIPLKGVEVEGEVLGAYARVKVRQRYENDERAPVEAVYMFPLPADATLTGFAMTCDGRRLEGTVQEREAAFRAYDDALVSGHGAALLEQERANVFTASVGNLLPGEETLVEVEYVQRVQADEGALRFMVPTLVAPRYVPGAAAGDRTAHGEKGPTDRVPDADRITPPRVADVPYGLRMGVTFDLGREVRVESPSHAVTSERDGARVRVTFAQGEVALDRDVVLVARGLATAAGQSTSLAAHRAQGSDGYLALGVVPDLWSLGAEAERGTRVVFLIDVSGSMEGDSIREARAALRLCLRHLRAGDRFNILAFSSTWHGFMRELTPFSQDSLDRADRWVEALAADGGTELLAPLERAVAMAPGGVVILLTDGQVGNEDEILRAVLARRGESRTRVCSFGIGTNVSDALLRDLARETGGAVEFIHPGERIDEKVVAQFSRAVAPRITDVALKFVGVDVGEVAPSKVPDLVDGEPWTVLARYAHGGAGHAEITGRYQGEPFALRVPLDLPEEAARPVVARLWAAERIRDLDDAKVDGRRADAMKARIVALAVEHGIASKHTSFVVVEHRTGERRSSGVPDTRVVPVGLPAGWASSDDARDQEETLTRAFGGGGAKKKAARWVDASAMPPATTAPAPKVGGARGGASPARRAAPSMGRPGSGGAYGGPPAPMPSAAAPKDATRERAKAAPPIARKEELSRADDAYELDDASPAAPAEAAMDFLSLDESPAPAPMQYAAPASPAAPAKKPADDTFALFARQLASGLWDDASLGADDDLRRLRATARVLRALVERGVDTTHPLHGAPLRKGLEALAALCGALAARDRDLVETALALAWVLATGQRTKAAIERTVGFLTAPELTAKMTKPGELRVWALTRAV